MLSVVKFYQDQRPWALAAGFFLFGLALWDKALASGCFPGWASPRSWSFDGICFRASTGGGRHRGARLCPGRFPLLVYNAGHHWITFTGNFNRDSTNSPVRHGCCGHCRRPRIVRLYDRGRLAHAAPSSAAHAPRALFANISAFAGHPRRDLLLYGVRSCALAGPVLRESRLRAILFTLITMAVTGSRWRLPPTPVAASITPSSSGLFRNGDRAFFRRRVAPAGPCRHSGSWPGADRDARASGALVINEYYALAAAQRTRAQSWNNSPSIPSRYTLNYIPAKSISVWTGGSSIRSAS